MEEREGKNGGGGFHERKRVFFVFIKYILDLGPRDFSLNSLKSLPCRNDVAFLFPSGGGGELKREEKIITGPARKRGVSYELHGI